MTDMNRGAKEAVAFIIERLERQRVNMHSLLILKGDELVCEAYWKPYRAEKLHRMFSISKSFTAVAVGLLIDDGKVELAAPIVKYFPDLVPEDVHPWIAEMTVEDCLMMRTCHASTTYKIDMKKDWVESFFTTAPTHPAGRFFNYDTSSAHTLCALVERISGMPMLNYIKFKLPELDLSEESYMIADPFGVSMGGSGMVATSMDMLKFGKFIRDKGCVNGKQLLSSEYVEKCTSFLSDTRMNAPLPSEAVGYGMQFWQNEKGSWVCYGMGGQFIINLPDLDMLVVTTADTIGRAGGNQIIYDAIYDGLYGCEEAKSFKLSLPFDKIINGLCMHSEVVIPNAPGSKVIAEIPEIYKKVVEGSTYRNSSESAVFDCFSLTVDDAVSEGCFKYTINGKDCEIHFGFGHLTEGSFPGYEMNYAASAVWNTKNTLYIRCHIIDEYIGSVHFQLNFTEEDLAIHMKKNEESLFNEYNCRVYAIKK